MSIKVKALTENAKLPTKAHAGDLGYDLYSGEEVLILPNTSRLVSTGVAVQLPEGYGALIKDRSSVASKHGVFTMAGVIDNGYIGEIKILFFNSGRAPMLFRVGDKVAQLVLTRTSDFEVEWADELESADQRGEGGFGSTGTT